MPRTKAPPWVKWLATDARKSLDAIKAQIDTMQLRLLRHNCDAIGAKIDEVQRGVLRGEREDETVAHLVLLRQAVDQLRESLTPLVNGITAEDIAAMVAEDKTVLALLKLKLQQQQGEHHCSDKGVDT